MKLGESKRKKKKEKRKKKKGKIKKEKPIWQLINLIIKFWLYIIVNLHQSGYWSIESSTNTKEKRNRK
jgi:hypothetical protein